MKRGALYPVLRSMEEQGLLGSHVEPSVSGPPRKYYVITDQGRETLIEWKKVWRRTLDFVAAALEEDVNQEGKVVEALLGVRMPRRPRVVAIDGGILARIKWWLTDRRTWTTLVYMFFQLPLGIFYFAMLVMTLTLSIGAIVGTPVSAVTGVPMIQTDNYNFVPSPWAVPFIIAVGALAIVALMHLVCAIGRLHGAYAKAMLVGSPEERQSLHAGT